MKDSRSVSAARDSPPVHLFPSFWRSGCHTPCSICSRPEGQPSTPMPTCCSGEPVLQEPGENGIGGWALIAAMLGIVVGAVLWAFGRRTTPVKFLVSRSQEGVEARGLDRIRIGTSLGWHVLPPLANPLGGGPVAGSGISATAPFTGETWQRTTPPTHIVHQPTGNHTSFPSTTCPTTQTPRSTRPSRQPVEITA